MPDSIALYFIPGGDTESGAARTTSYLLTPTPVTDVIPECGKAIDWNSAVRLSRLVRHITVDTQSAEANCIYHPWDLPDSAVTPEAYYLRRREFLRVFRQWETVPGITIDQGQHPRFGAIATPP